MIWSDDLKERVILLIREGKSGTQISDTILTTMGVSISRNSVCGWAWRNGFSLGVTQTGEKAVRPPVQRVKKAHETFRPKMVLTPIEGRKSIKGVRQPPQQVIMPTVPKIEIADRSGAIAAVMSMPRFGRCRWPSGDPKDASFAFCMEATRANSIYCECHHAIAYTPRTQGKAA